MIFFLKRNSTDRNGTMIKCVIEIDCFRRKKKRARDKSQTSID
jgi:hypothetical protein